MCIASLQISVIHATTMKVFLLLLLINLAVVLIADHRPSCNFCLNTCSSTASYDTSLCKCDADCGVFGDCCGDHTPPSSCPTSQLPPLPDGVKLECISTYLDTNIPVQVDGEAFLMVSTCPDSWIETEGGITAENCTSPNSTATMPPVTSTVTGMVYRNEYCALCNGVSELVAWQTNLVCNPRAFALLINENISDILLSEPDILIRECQECSFHNPAMTSPMTSQTTPLDIGNKAPRSCNPSKNKCLPRMLLELITQSTLENEAYALLVRECVSGVVDLVRDISDGVVYRNLKCAICNGANKINIECYMLPIRVAIPEVCFPPIADIAMTTIFLSAASTEAVTFSTENTTNFSSEVIVKSAPVTSINTDMLNIFFTITLSNLGGGMVSISTMLGSTNISLDCPEGTAPVSLECRPTQCPEGYSQTGGRCSYIFPSPAKLPNSNIMMENCSTGILVLNETDYFDLGNGTIILADDESAVAVMAYDENGRPIICKRNVSFLDCPTPLLPLNKSDYIDLGNKSIVYQRKTLEVKFYDKLGRPLICPENTTSTRVTITTTQSLATPPGIRELTYAGCSLSLLGTITILLTYTLFREFRTLPGLLLMNLCITVFATNLIFIAGDRAIQSYPVKELCTSLAVALHFSYLSQFAWMSIFSCEMVRNFYKARQLLTDSSKTKQQLFAAYLCIGWCLPLAAIAISITLNFSVDGLVLYGVDKDGRIAGCWINHFESSIISFLIPLILSLTCNLLMFVLTTILLCRFSRDQSKLETSNTFTLLRVWLAIFSTTGVTWIFGFVALISQVNWAWYPFVIFKSTQGLTMFLAFLFTKKVLRLYVGLFDCKKWRKHILKNTNTRKTSSTRIGLTKGLTITLATQRSADILGGDKVLTVDSGGTVNKDGGEAWSRC